MGVCYAVENPTFQRAMRLISAITQAVVPQVTTTFAHNYQTGLIVRFHIPYVCGMQQLHNKTATITVTGATTFTFDSDTSTYDPFAIPDPANPNDNICAQVIPIGEVNSILSEATQNVLPY